MAGTIWWDRVGERIYETGVKKCVLYIMKSNGTYDAGVVWNGITSISSNDTGSEESSLWADDIKYASLRSVPEYGGTIEAYQCPIEFYECDGTIVPVEGVMIGQQSKKRFGLSYITTIGNDIEGTNYGYKIHIVYGCSASTSERAYRSINDSPDVVSLSWEFTTIPVDAERRDLNLKPIAHITIDSTKTDPEVLQEIEETLFGSEYATARLPLPKEVIRTFTERPYGLLDVNIYLD